MCAVIVAIAMAGCGDDDAPPFQHGSIDARCPLVAECDITAARCQQAVLEATACERRQDAPAPPVVRTLARSQLGAEYRADAEREASDDAPSNLLGAGPWDAALAALHLLPVGTGVVEASIDDAVDNVAAYYDPRDKRLTIIEDSAAADRLSAMYILSHELTHYLQDDALDLTRMQQEAGATTDSQMALTALVEGDAMVTSVRVAVRLQGGSARNVLWDDTFASMQQSVLATIERSTAPLITAANGLPYPVGGRYVSSAWNGGSTGTAEWYGSRERVDDLFGTPMRSLADVLSGYPGQTPTTTQREMLDCAPPEPPAGFQLAGIDHLGATGALALLAAGGRADLELAGGTRGDLIALYHAADTAAGSEAESALVAWRLRFDSALTASQFLQRIAPLELAAQGFEREVLITAGTGADNPLLAATVSCPNPDDFASAARSVSMMPGGGLPVLHGVRSPPRHARQ
jgi:hypothetical protein